MSVRANLQEFVCECACFFARALVNTAASWYTCLCACVRVCASACECVRVYVSACVRA